MYKNATVGHIILACANTIVGVYVIVAVEFGLGFAHIDQNIMNLLAIGTFVIVSISIVMGLVITFKKRGTVSWWWKALAYSPLLVMLLDIYLIDVFSKN